MRAGPRHGVQELWVIDAATRDTWVHHGPAADGNWANIDRVLSKAAVSPLALPGLAIRMADLD
jgi:Uma2 family endonuclease